MLYTDPSAELQVAQARIKELESHLLTQKAEVDYCTKGVLPKCLTWGAKNDLLKTEGYKIEPPGMVGREKTSEESLRQQMNSIQYITKKHTWGMSQIDKAKTTKCF